MKNIGVACLAAVAFLFSSCATAPVKISKIDFNVEELTDVTGMPQGEKTYLLENGVLYLASKSKVTLYLESYCLNANLAAPDIDEPYYFVPARQILPMYKEIMSYFVAHTEIGRGLKQRLIWNLANDVKFEDLSSEERALLLKIDPLAPVKLNNIIKEKARKSVLGFISGLWPQKIPDVLTTLKGRPYSYEEYERQILALQKTTSVSSYADVVPQPVGDTGLYAIAYSRGYSKMKVTVYNPSNPKSIIMNFVDWFTKHWKDAMKQSLSTLGGFADDEE
jgi:hypothetical protein